MFVSRTTSSDTGYDDSISYASVRLTSEIARLILERAKLFAQAQAQDRSLQRMEFWGNEASFFGYSAQVLGLDAMMDSDEPLWTAIDPFDCVGPQRTECDRMVIDDRGAHWRAIAKHTDVYVETQLIPFDRVKAFLAATANAAP